MRYRVRTPSLSYPLPACCVCMQGVVLMWWSPLDARSTVPPTIRQILTSSEIFYEIQSSLHLIPTLGSMFDVFLHVACPSTPFSLISSLSLANHLLSALPLFLLIKILYYHFHRHSSYRIIHSPHLFASHANTTSNSFSELSLRFLSLLLSPLFFHF